MIPNQLPAGMFLLHYRRLAANDPDDTQCSTQLNEMIYSQPAGVPKPLFLPGMPPAPYAQPWRNLWYTFELSGSGVCTLQTQVLSGVNRQPLIAVYESDVNASIPWSSLQNDLISPQDTIVSGLRLLNENVTILCNADVTQLFFNKSGCIRDSVRYYIVVVLTQMLPAIPIRRYRFQLNTMASLRFPRHMMNVQPQMLSMGWWRQHHLTLASLLP